MRIYMICNRYLPVIGGAERQLSLLAHYLLDQGHEVTVVTRRLTADLLPREAINGIPVVRLNPVGLSKVANILIVFRLIYFLIVQRSQFDVLHSQSLGPVGLATITAGWILRKPVVIRAAGAGDIERKRDGYALSLWSSVLRRYILPPALWNAILQKASALVAISEEIAEEAQRHLPGTLVVRIPNGVDVDALQPPAPDKKQDHRAALNLPVTGKLLFFAGRLVNLKRVDVLIEAMPEVLSVFPDCTLILAGSGYLQADSVEADLRSRVQSLGIDRHVIFTGDTDKVSAYLQAADVFVFPSAKEGMPNVVLEAMAAGLAIIASRIGGVTDLLDDESAWLLPVGDISVWQAAIIEALQNAEVAEKRGQLVREQVMAHFSVESVGRQYEQLYEGLMR